MTRSSLLRITADALAEFDPDGAAGEAEIILTTVLRCSRHELFTGGTGTVDKSATAEIKRILDRRKHGEPLAYILGKSWFYGREFTISPSVLIPRSDTETLIQIILDSEKGADCFFADIGTGSGCIVHTLLNERPLWRGIGIDRSIPALKIAQSNRAGNGALCAADLFTACKAQHQFDFIVSNPPYIATAVMTTLDTTVRDFEPHLALWGGNDGLDFYRTILSNAHRFLKSAGRLYLEIGYDQKDAVSALFAQNNWQQIVCHKDLCRNDRVITAVFLPTTPMDIFY